MDERAAFEKAIDENPLDSNTHLAYSDWLQENGEHRESALHKEIATWAQADKYLEPNRPDASRRWKFVSSLHDLPGHMRRVARDVMENGDEHDDGSDTHVPGWHMSAGSVYRKPHGFVHAVGWPSYRHFEEDFRQSHAAARQDPDRMSRRIRARKLSRRSY